MVSKKVTIVNAQGFHMRPANVFAAAMMKHPCDVTLRVNGKDVKCGNEVEVICNGAEEDAALAEAVEMIESGFGE